VTSSERSRPRAVLLDALGTLVTFTDPAPRLRALLAQRHGVRVGEDEARQAMVAEVTYYRREHDRAVDAASLAQVRRECAQVLVETLGLSLDPEALVATLVEAIAFEAYPDAPPALDALRARGMALAVVSNWDVSLGEALARTGLADRVDAVVVSALVGAAKPDPALFDAALERLGVAAVDAVHVGDTYDDDIVGARAAGVRPVLISRYGTPAPADVEAIADLRELLALL
jgi:putative hydrolase of the HAD superfamily